MDMSMLPDDLVQKVKQAWSLSRSLQSQRDAESSSRKRVRDESSSDDTEPARVTNGQKKKAKKARAAAWKVKQAKPTKVKPAAEDWNEWAAPAGWKKRK